MTTQLLRDKNGPGSLAARRRCTTSAPRSDHRLTILCGTTPPPWSGESQVHRARFVYRNSSRWFQSPRQSRSTEHFDGDDESIPSGRSPCGKIDTWLRSGLHALLMLRTWLRLRCCVGRFPASEGGRQARVRWERARMSQKGSRPWSRGTMSSPTTCDRSSKATRPRS